MEMSMKSSVRTTEHVNHEGERVVLGGAREYPITVEPAQWMAKQMMSELQSDMSAKTTEKAVQLAAILCLQENLSVAQVGDKLLEDLSAAGVIAARYNLALRHLNGKHTSTDKSRGYLLMCEVVETERPVLDEITPKLFGMATCVMGNCFVVGNGVPQSVSLASKYYELSGQNGNQHGAFNAGTMYVPPQVQHDDADYEKAAHWFDIASRMGSIEAQTQLALLHLNQMIQKADRRHGFRLLSDSVLHGDDIAYKVMAELKNHPEYNSVAGLDA